MLELEEITEETFNNYARMAIIFFQNGVLFDIVENNIVAFEYCNADDTISYYRINEK